MSALVQNTAEWLEMRKNKIGSSDAPVIMGVSPWRTPYQLWLDKLSSEQADKTPQMQRGHDLEEKARQEFESMTGLIVVPCVVQHPDYEWMIASLDGMDFEQKNIVEIKCPGHEDHALALRDKIPDKYYPQLQHQIEVTGLEKVSYFSYDGVAGKVVDVYRDEKFIALMLDLEKQFWYCMQTMESPRLMERDYIQKDDELWLAATAEWKRLHRQAAEIKAKEEELRETLIALSGRKNVCGGGVKLARIIRKGSVDYKAIPQLQEVDLELYRGAPTESWRITEHA